MEKRGPILSTLQLDAVVVPVPVVAVPAAVVGGGDAVDRDFEGSQLQI